jgi:hypothetical protein
MLPFYHGIFSALLFFSTARHRGGIASGATPLMQHEGQLIESFCIIVMPACVWYSPNHMPA